MKEGGRASPKKAQAKTAPNVPFIPVVPSFASLHRCHPTHTQIRTSTGLCEKGIVVGWTLGWTMTSLPAPADAAPSVPTAHELPLPSSTATVLKKIEKWWLYASYGKVIAGSRVIPMKTPLPLELQERQARLAQTRGRSSSMDGVVVPGQELGQQREHTIGGFVRAQAEEEGRIVGLVVDLSNHECLYADDLVAECPEVAYQHFHFGTSCSCSLFELSRLEGAELSKVVE